MRNLVYTTLLSVFFTSCNTGMLPFYFENRNLDMVPVEILEPASLTLPAHIQNLAITVPDTSNKDIGLRITIADTSFMVYSENDNVLDIIGSSLMDNLAYSPRFGMSNEQPLILSENALTWEQYDSICAVTGADAVLTLDSYKATYRFVTSDTYVLEYESYFYKAYLEVAISSSWSIRDPFALERHVFRIDHSDSYEGGLSYNQKEAIETLPELTEIVYYDASVTGSKCANTVSPHWVRSERGIYARSNKLLRKAKRIILEDNNWEEARTIWQTGVESPNRVIAKHSRFNLVVAEEVLGNINDAIQKAKVYLAKYNDVHMNEYLELLTDRAEKMKLLDQQFHVSNNKESMLRVQRYF